ncbi:MAG: hypothetical protein VX768_07465 [Planctomycetota bacterium]|nr:hypothetical protein [Planctomycetota bacterium]
MPDNYESNWDDLARQFGFEADDSPSDTGAEQTDSGNSEEPGTLDGIDNPADGIPVDEKSSDVSIGGETAEAATAESITDFFEEPMSDFGAAASEDKAEPDRPQDSMPLGSDHWGSLAGELGLEEEAAAATDGGAGNVLPEPVGDSADRSDAGEKLEPETEAEEVASEGSAGGDTGSEVVQTVVDGIETVEFDLQDLEDEDDRPRRRRKKRRRRRAVIEELREELEREKEEEATDTVEETTEDEVEKPVVKKEPERRRRRRKERSATREENSGKVREPADREDRAEDDTDEKVSKNQKRRKKREDSGDADRSDSRSRNRRDNAREESADGEAKPERKFPTWEEAIMPVVEANMSRTRKPQRKRRPRRRED